MDVDIECAMLSGNRADRRPRHPDWRPVRAQIALASEGGDGSIVLCSWNPSSGPRWSHGIVQQHSEISNPPEQQRSPRLVAAARHWRAATCPADHQSGAGVGGPRLTTLSRPPFDQLSTGGQRCMPCGEHRHRSTPTSRPVSWSTGCRPGAGRLTGCIADRNHPYRPPSLGPDLEHLQVRIPITFPSATGFAPSVTLHAPTY